LLGDRRRFQPYGLAGGESASVGRTLLLQPGQAAVELAAKSSSYVKKGDVLRIETPGGGGWGAA
jgi:N-methylhydantoinase B